MILPSPSFLDTKLSIFSLQHMFDTPACDCTLTNSGPNAKAAFNLCARAQATLEEFGT